MLLPVIVTVTNMPTRLIRSQPDTAAGVGERLALAAAECGRVLETGVHLRLSRAGVLVRRSWAARNDIPDELLVERLSSDPDWVVRSRLVGSATLGFTTAHEHLRLAGRGAAAVVALRTDCPDDIGAELLTAISKRNWESVQYALTLGRQRGVRLYERPATVRAVLNDLSSFSECTELAHLLDSETDRAILWQRIEAAVRGEWSNFYIGGMVQEGLDFMYHEDLLWLQERLKNYHRGGCHGCELREYEPANKEVHRWWLPAATALNHDVLRDVWRLYGRESGDVLTILLAGSAQPFWRVVEAVGRLTKDPIIDEVVEEAGFDGTLTGRDSLAEIEKEPDPF